MMPKLLVISIHAYLLFVLCLVLVLVLVLSMAPEMPPIQQALLFPPRMR